MTPMNPKRVVVLGVAVLTVAASGCTPLIDNARGSQPTTPPPLPTTLAPSSVASMVTGTVYARESDYQTGTDVLVIRSGDGRLTAIGTSADVWQRCRLFTTYPACTQGAQH